jgi:hypothetical protein
MLEPHGGVMMIQVMTIPKVNKLPHMDVPACGSVAGFAIASDFKIDQVPGSRFASAFCVEG